MSQQTITPQWAEDYLQYWRQILLLQEWQFIISLTAEPLGDAANLAGVTLQPDYNTARIEIRDDIPQDINSAGAIEKYQWKRAILHEVLHIRLGRLTEFVRQEMMNDIQPSLCGLISRQFTGLVESHIEIMTGVLYEMDEAGRAE